MKNFSRGNELSEIIKQFKAGDDTPLDGDEVDDLCNIIKSKINLIEGNITTEEYEQGSQVSSKKKIYISDQHVMWLDDDCIYACPINEDGTCDFNEDKTVILEEINAIDDDEKDTFNKIKVALFNDTNLV